MQIARNSRSQINQLLHTSETDPTTLLFFCDGSRMRSDVGTERSGCGVVCYCAGKIIHIHSIGLGRRSSVRRRNALTPSPIVSTADVSCVFFYSDSSLAVSEIFSPLLHPSQITSLVFLRHMSHVFSSPLRQGRQTSDSTKGTGSPDSLLSQTQSKRTYQQRTETEGRGAHSAII